MSEQARFDELASLWAIGAASDVERAELERMVAATPALAASLAEWEATASSFAESLEPMAPPANGLRELRAALGGAKSQKRTLLGVAPAPIEVANPEYATRGAEPTRSEDQGVISLAARRQRRLFAGGLSVAMAAAAAFLFLWLRERDRATDAFDSLEKVALERDQAIEAVRTDAQIEIDRLARELDSSADKVRNLAARFEPLRAAKLELATVGGPGGYAHVFAESGTGETKWLVLAESLPILASDKDYQLWFVPEGKAPVSAGLLRAGPDGVLSATPTIPSELRGTKLRPAISLEPAGGSAQPTEVVLIGAPI